MGIENQKQLIGLLTGQDPQVLIGMLGILQAGQGFVPLDPRHPDERLGFVIADCRLKILVTEALHLPQALRLAEKSATLRHLICLDTPPADLTLPENVQLHTLAESTGLPAATPPANLDQLAYVIYTSGSTGMPKGVLISQRNLLPILNWSREYFQLGPHTTVLQTLNPCFDFGVMEQLTTVLNGGTMHYLDLAAREDLARYGEYIQAHAINTVHATPAFFKGLISLSEPLPTLKLIHLGGDAFTPELAEFIYSKVGADCRLYNGYGPTEASINCAIYTLPEKSRFDKTAQSSLPIGRASANNTLYILDPQGQLCPIGVPGELHVGGPALSMGYLDRAALTAERFIPDAFGSEPGGRLYRTGDLVRYRADGEIEFMGRLDFQVKIRGFRIELGEIEAALTDHPAVREVVVMARTDPHGELRLVAYIQPAAPFDVTEVAQFLQTTLPPYMVPAAFVTMESWPLTPNGKIDRKALPEPDSYQQEAPTVYIAPRTPIETGLVEIWQELLKHSPIGINDDFFELGGHSLLATQVISRIRQTLNVALPLHLLLDHPTVAELAPLVEERQQAAAPVSRITSRRAQPQPAPRPELQAALAEFSEAELAAMLSEMLAKKQRGEA